jgi:hypothetical protein
MAKFNNGINGPFSGKLGTVVGSTYMGEPYMRAAPTKGRMRKKKSKDAKANRNKFGGVHAWLHPLLDLLRIGFRGYKPRSHGYNGAKSYTLDNCLQIVNGIKQINPALVKVSYGDLPLPDGLAVEKSASGLLTFSWDGNTELVNGASASDQVMIAVYNPEKSYSGAYIKLTGNFRHTGMDTMKVAKGQTCHVYIAFIAADRSRQSESVYLGEITV